MAELVHVETIDGPRRASPRRGLSFVADGIGVLRDPFVGRSADTTAYELAGPRALVRYGEAARAGILTAGGTCPGINDVVRGLVMELVHGYGLSQVLGLRDGYAGLAASRRPPLVLSPSVVADIHRSGGTILGTSRGRHDCGELADGVRELGLDLLFCIGGDGSLKGAASLEAELRRRGSTCAVVAIPKTIDNDIPHCTRTFGFMTAVEEAARAIAGAHVEARAHRNGIGLVQLMGRESGFIAATATLACPDVNFCLVPEIPFELEGPDGLLAAIRARLGQREHAVIVVAEGAGADLRESSGGEPARDASGNVKHPPIGPRLAAAIGEAAAQWPLDVTIKVIDPSYMVRSVPADTSDHLLCGHLAQMAVHAALAGRTGIMIGLLRDEFVHVPLEDACAGRKRLDPLGALWQGVLSSTGQPPLRALHGAARGDATA